MTMLLLPHIQRYNERISTQLGVAFICTTDFRCATNDPKEWAKRHVMKHN